MADIDRSVLRSKIVSGHRYPIGHTADVITNACTFKPQDGDFFIATYPKCGTTWTQNIVHLIYSGGVPFKNTAEFFAKSPFLELLGKESCEQLERPGGIKTHLHFHITPYSEKAKYLYVARNPKDVVVSFFHHATSDPLFLFQDGTFDTFFEHFMNGTIGFDDYFDHVLGWYPHRHEPNFMFITYEELKQDPKESIMKIAKFMGDKWYEQLKNPEVLDNVLKFSSLQYMKSNFTMDLFGSENQISEEPKTLFPGLQAILQFIQKHHMDGNKTLSLVRNGVVGSWREVLSTDQIARLDKKIEERLNGTDLYTYWKSINCI